MCGYPWQCCYRDLANGRCCSLQIWDVYSILPAEFRLPASRSALPHRQHRLQGGGQRGPGQGLLDRAEGDVEAAHQPAVWRPAHANPRLLSLPRPHPQGGRVPEDGLQLEDEGGAGQLDAQCLLCGLCTRLVCQGKKLQLSKCSYQFTL